MTKHSEEESKQPETEGKSEGKTVTMVFPKEVMIQTEPGTVKTFPAGTQEVPAELADHWFLKAQGVTKYDAKAEKDKSKDKDNGNGKEDAEKPSGDKPRKATEHEVAFLNAKNYARVKTVADAQEFIDNLEPEMVSGFWEEVDQWKAKKTK